MGILTAAAALASSFVAFLCRAGREVTELSSVSRENADIVGRKDKHVGTSITPITHFGFFFFFVGITIKCHHSLS